MAWRCLSFLLQVPSNAHRHQFFIKNDPKCSTCSFMHWNICESPCSSTGCDNTQSNAQLQRGDTQWKVLLWWVREGLEEKLISKEELNNTLRWQLFPAQHTPSTPWSWKKCFVQESRHQCFWKPLRSVLRKMIKVKSSSTILCICWPGWGQEGQLCCSLQILLCWRSVHVIPLRDN